MTFPTCELHGYNIVSQLPAGCPLGFANPLARLTDFRARGLWDGSSDPHSAVATSAMADMCTSCIDRLLRDHHIRHLRARGPLQ